MKKRRFLVVFPLLFLSLSGAIVTLIARRWTQAVERGAAEVADRKSRHRILPHIESNKGAAAPGEWGVHVRPSPLEESEEPSDPFGLRNPHPARLAGLGWTTGLTWKVETYYRNLQHSVRASWSSTPIVWRFTVRGIERLDGRDVWVVDVEPTDQSGMPFNPGGTVYVAPDDHTVIALRDRVQENGLIRERYMKVEEGGSAFTSLLPIDLPPPGLEGSKGASSVGALPPNPFRPDPKVEPPRMSGTALDVEFEVDGERIRQRWDAAIGHWPVYSATPSRVSYLR